LHAPLELPAGRSQRIHVDPIADRNELTIIAITSRAYAAADRRSAATALGAIANVGN